MPTRKQAASALSYIMPILDKFDLKWCISGGFAAYLYGVNRPIVDIDIDVETNKDDPKFVKFMEEIKPFTKLPLTLWKDRNFDHYVMDVVVDGQLLSIITTKDMDMMNKKTGKYELFYKNGIPKKLNRIEFENLQLPVLTIEWVIKMKEAFAYPSKISLKDINELKKLKTSRKS